MVGSRLAALTSIATGFVLTAPLAANPVTNSAISGATEAASSAESANLVAAQSARPAKGVVVSRKSLNKAKQPYWFGTKIPEPSNFMMLTLGIAGLVAGRWAAGRRGKNKAD